MLTSGDCEMNLFTMQLFFLFEEVKGRYMAKSLTLFSAGGGRHPPPTSGFLIAIRKRVNRLPQDLVTFHTMKVRTLYKILEKIGRAGAVPGPVSGE